MDLRAVAWLCAEFDGIDANGDGELSYREVFGDDGGVGKSSSSSLSTPEALRAPVFEYKPYSFASHEEKMPRSARKRRIIMDALLFFFVSKNSCL